MKSERTSHQLADVIDLIGGGTPKTSISEYWDGEIPWISVKDFNNDNRYVYTTEKSITKAGLGNSSTKLLAYDDIIISARGTVGELAMIPFPMAFNQSCYGIRGKKDIIIQPYLYYLLKDSMCLLKSQTHGSVFDTITRETFANIKISLPSIPEQQMIADILSALDDKITVNGNINHHLEQIAQAIFNELYFTGDLSILGDYLTDIESGSRPKGGALLSGIPSIGAENIERFGVYDYSKEKYISLDFFQRLQRGVVKSGDVLLYKDGAYTGKTSMALGGFPHQQCAINEHVFILRTNNKMPSQYFLYLLLRLDENREKLFTMASSKAAQPGLNQNEVKALQILIPNVKLIAKFNNEVEPLFKQIANNALENRRLAELRDTLLPKLMSGELSVSDIVGVK